MEETIDSKGQELLALNEQRKSMDRKDKAQVRGSNRESETTKDPKNVRKYGIFLNNSKE